MKGLLYLITRQGVYRHEILGVFSSESLALKEAQELSLKEPDEYHSIIVSTSPLGEIIPDVIKIAEYRKDRDANLINLENEVENKQDEFNKAKENLDNFKRTKRV